MAISTLSGKWSGLITAVILLCGLLAGCASAGASPASGSQPDEVATLQQQVAVQQTSIAALQAQAALAQVVASQATQIAALQTQVAAAQAIAAAPKQVTSAPTAAVPSQPTATIIPAVAGLVTDGNTKGAASARVTILEYIDYF